VRGPGLNTERPPFDDPEVRRALAIGIDRKTTPRRSGSYARIATSPIVGSVWAHDKSIIPGLRPGRGAPPPRRQGLRRPRWRRLLDRGGKPLAFEVISNAGNRQRNDAAVDAPGAAQEVGIRVTPRVSEFNSLITETKAGDFDAAIVAWAWTPAST